MAKVIKISSSRDAFSETWQTTDSTLNGACYAALGASSLLGASSSYGPVELIFLLPEGWMALHYRMKAVHWGWSPLSWWCSSPRSWCGGRPRKNLVFLNSVYVLSFATCPDWQYSCFFLVRKFTVKSMSAQFQFVVWGSLLWRIYTTTISPPTGISECLISGLEKWKRIYLFVGAHLSTAAAHKLWSRSRLHPRSFPLHISNVYFLPFL